MNPIAFRKPLLLAAMTAAFAAGAAHAQVTEPTDQPVSPPSESQSAPAPADQTAPSAQATTPIDDRKIEQFADAYVAVQEIQAHAAEKLDKTTDPEKQQQAQAAVENEMIAAVEKSGLKLEEFNSIVQTMTADANLRARVVGKIRERTGG